MNIINRKKAQLSVAAVAALAIFAVAAVVLLAGGFTTGPAQAQSTTYPDPQPCGPGHAKVSHSPVKTITTGEIAFFDSYWDIETKTINNNLCPPSIVTRTEEQGRQTVTKITRADARIDIAQTVIHVTDDYKVTVVAGEAGEKQISLAEYPFLRKGLGLGDNESPKAGTQVYWLRLDDPDTEEVETSNLRLGFSTELFDGKYWESRGDAKPFQYEFESERDYVSEVHGPHFFAFEAPKPNNGVQEEAIWDSYNADINKMPMDAGERQNLQWVFTEPGSHHIEVHVIGHVRKNVEDPSDDWKNNPPEEETVTSEVQLYTIQTGALTFVNPPVFTAGTLTVATDAAAGDFLNGVIPMWGHGQRSGSFKFEVLNYQDGSVSDVFEPYEWVQDSFSGVNGVQLRVKDGAYLGDGAPSFFKLLVTVRDGKDRLGHPDDSVDHWITVRVQRTN